jgi:hypothetical protein
MKLAHISYLFLAATVPSMSEAAQVAFRWDVQTAMAGTLVAYIRNSQGAYFRLSCSAGAEPALPDLSFDPPKTYKVSSDEPIQVVVDGESASFNLSDEFESPEDRLHLAKLASTIAASKARTFDVELPRLQRKESFSLKGAREVLQEGNGTILDDCL